MSLMDCYLLGLQPNAETRPYRTTSNAASLVVEDDGASTIGAETISWQKYDVFTLPVWQWVLHKAIARDTRLFQVADREVLRRLDLLRAEFGD